MSNTAGVPVFIQEDGTQVVPEAKRVNFSGSDEAPAHILKHNEYATLIVRGKPGEVKFVTDAFGVTRAVQSFKVAMMMPAPDPVVEAAEAEAKRRADDESGQQSLDDELEGVEGDPEETPTDE